MDTLSMCGVLRSPRGGRKGLWIQSVFKCWIQVLAANLKVAPTSLPISLFRNTGSVVVKDGEICVGNFGYAAPAVSKIASMWFADAKESCEGED